MEPKILVGCPTSDYKEYCLEEYSKAVKSLTYKNYDILLVDNSKNENYIKKIRSFNLPVIKGPYFPGAKKRIIKSRNLLREKAIEGKYDYFLSLEQDIIPPKDIIERLLKAKKDIISAVYFMPRDLELVPMIAIKEGESYGYIPFNYVDKSKEIIRVDYTGLGSLLISRKVIEKIEFKTDAKPGFDDWWFCKDAKKNNFKIYADTSIKCKHLLNNRPWSWKDIKL